MKTLLFAFALCVAAIAVRAESYKAVQLSSDQAHLAITTTDGKQFDAPLLKDQVGFQNPLVSKDGKHVGWLALFPNCCTSYPIPLSLVVLDGKRHVREFTGIQLATFRWCFEPDSASVAFMQTQVHGTNYEHFEHHALSNGRLLAEYEYPDEESENKAARDLAPEWVHCVPE